MIRNLRALMVAGLAVLAFSAVAVSSASAASISKPGEAINLTVTPDGSGTQAHQVFDAAGASITCPGVTGEATIAGTGTSFTTAQSAAITYTGECKFVGQKATVNMNGCDYHFEASGIVTVNGCEGKEIEFSVPSPACKVTVPAQGPLSSVTYSNANANEVTVTAHVAGITYTAVGAGCPTAGEQSNGNYTTGNFLLTGEKHSTQSMVAVQYTP